jgi:hypothetical protein
MSNNLVPYQSIGADANAALKFVETMGDAFAKGGLVGCNTPGQGRMLALTCLCEGITPLEFARTYHLIEGKPTMRSDAMLAKFRQAGGKTKWLNVGDDGKEARAEWTYDGQTLDLVYSIEDAKRAGVVKQKSAWEKDPGSMLRARLISKAVRILAPEIVAGVYSPEEMDATIETEATPTNGKPRGKKTPSCVEEKAPVEDAEIVTAPADTTPDVPFSTQDTAETVDEPEPAHTVISGVTVTSSDPEKADPSVINEIRDLAGSDPSLRGTAEQALGTYKIKAVRSLNRRQSMQVLCVLLAHKAGEGGKLQGALKKMGCDTILDLDEAKAAKMISFLRQRVEAAEKKLEESIPY